MLLFDLGGTCPKAFVIGINIVGRYLSYFLILEEIYPKDKELKFVIAIHIVCKFMNRSYFLI